MSDAPELAEIIQQPQRQISADALQAVGSEFFATKLALAEANVRLSRLAAENEQLRDAGLRLLQESAEKSSKNSATGEVVPMPKRGG